MSKKSSSHGTVYFLQYMNDRELVSMSPWNILEANMRFGALFYGFLSSETGPIYSMWDVLLVIGPTKNAEEYSSHMLRSLCAAVWLMAASYVYRDKSVYKSCFSNRNHN